MRPELLVLATGTGSLILSHVNDPGFWLIQSFFKMELKETLSHLDGAGDGAVGGRAGNDAGALGGAAVKIYLALA